LCELAGVVLLGSAGAVADSMIDQVCDGIQNAFECSERIEQSMIEAEDRVSRSGVALDVELSGGEMLRFVDGPAADRLVYHYSFRECIDEAARCVVFKGRNEWLRYVIVDLVTGRQEEHWRQPHFSPDGSRFILAGAWGPHGSRDVEIRTTQADELEFGLTSDEVKSLAKNITRCDPTPIIFESWASIAQIHWRSDHEIEFQVRCFQVSDQSERSEMLVLREGEDGWSLDNSAE